MNFIQITLNCMNNKINNNMNMNNKINNKFPRTIE